MDDTLVKGLSLNDAVSHMRGKEGSKIVLTISRKSEPKLLTFTLTRAVIKVQSVKSKQIEPGYGYVRITQFQELTGENLASVLEEFYKQNQGSLKGLVLDLRNDPGGLLTSAVGVSAAFLNKDALVVYTEGRTDDAKMQLTANPQNYAHGSGGKDYLSKLPEAIKSVPLVVLVNGGSASASEIVAGALQDHKRAIIMGTQTFGKGSVQTILPLGNNTGIKLTTARYYTPNGRSIQAKGIEPDILVEDPSNSHEEGLLTLHEADLGRHLINDKNTAAVSTSATKKVAPVSELKEDAAKFIPVEFGAKNDYQLNQAMNLLKGMQILKGM
jgi:carboxyl-terminal processing protease